MGALAVLWLLKIVDVSAYFPALALKACGLINHNLAERGGVRVVGSDLASNALSQPRAKSSYSLTSSIPLGNSCLFSDL